MSASPAQLVARARELARTQLASALASALDGLPAEFQTLAAAATSPEEARLLDDTTREVSARRDAIAAEFERQLLALFDRKIRPTTTETHGTEPTFDQLTLVDDAVMELEVARGRLVRKLVGELDADQLSGVGARLGALAGGRSLEGAANPLGPETALEALQAACSVATEDGSVRMTLVNGLQPHVAAALGRLYSDLNEMLRAAGILPRIRHEIQRARNAPVGPRGAGAASPGDTSAASAAAGGLPAGMTVSQAIALKDLLPGATGSPVDLGAIVAVLLEGSASMRQYGAKMLANPEGSLFERAMATPVHPEVLAELAQLQGTVIPDATAGAAGLRAVVQQVGRAQHHPLDQLTGELVAVVFDFLLHDRDVAEAVKTQIARLQVVAFKAALLDRSFFARREHPLRELLSAIADAAADPEVDTEPESRFVAGLRAIVDEVLGRFTDDLAVFTAARENLAALTGELAAEGERAVESLTAPLVEQERLDALRTRARIEVAKRAAGAPAFVRDFLTETWSQVVAGAGENGWDANLAIADDLLWSVVPKQPAELPRFTALLPKLVPALGRGMNAINVPANARQAFLDELMGTHTALLQAARVKHAPAPPVAAPPPVRPPAEREIAPSPEVAADAMLGLERGAIVEFSDPDGMVRAKLSWISPGRTLYLFTAHGAKARRVSPGELRAALREDRARLVEEGRAVVERALAAVAGR